MYTIHQFGNMIADRGRAAAYAGALRAAVGPDTVVLDLGAGPGNMTLVACQAGARRVYAVEASHVIQLAREMVAANGYSDRVVFLAAQSTDVNLPERADVIVTDIRGTLPWLMGSIRSMIDARVRLLKPNGRFIPSTDVVWAAPVRLPEPHDRMVAPWDRLAGFDGRPGRHRAVNGGMKVDAPADSLVADPLVFARLDYSTLTDLGARGRLEWTIPSSSSAHGLLIWFDCEAAPGFGFSNSPRSDESHIYQQVFLPWPEARTLVAGDRVAVDLRTDLVGDDYLWTWNTDIHAAPGHAGSAQFRQSLFHGLTVSEEWQRKSASSFVATPNQDAAIDRMILEQLFAAATLQEIADRVRDRFPARFRDERAALTRVGELSIKYSE